jgi:hypothetical protein
VEGGNEAAVMAGLLTRFPGKPAGFNNIESGGRVAPRRKSMKKR